MSSANTKGAIEHHHAHHFADANEEFEASKQGMWVFLVTEVLMFGGLFVAYGIFRGMYPEMFREAHHMLDWKMGGLNTVVLITSSLTMAMAVGAAARGEKKKAFTTLGLTFLWPVAFWSEVLRVHAQVPRWAAAGRLFPQRRVEESKDSVVLFDLLRNDGIARRARSDRHGSHRLADAPHGARRVSNGLLHACGVGWLLLALCGLGVDLPFPAALPSGLTRESDHGI